MSEEIRHETIMAIFRLTNHFTIEDGRILRPRKPPHPHELAEELGLSESGCAKRLKKLQQNGDVAIIDLPEPESKAVIVTAPRAQFIGG